MADARRTDRPEERATRLCAAMTDALEVDGEYGPDVRAVIFISVGERGGIVIHNYPEEPEGQHQAIADVMSHVQALFEANGIDMQILTVPEPGYG